MSTTTETEQKRYNGWTNYETWCVALWMDNEQGTQEHWAAWAGQVSENAGTDREMAVRELAEMMQEEHEEGMHELLEGAKASCSVWADLLGAALSEVNWREIAENKLEVAV